MDIQDKVFVVTGGARGLGAGMAEHLAAKGARLALIDMDEDALKEKTEHLNQQKPVARAYVCDITSEEQVGETFARIKEDLGAIHGLINNAGLLRDGMLIKVKDGKLVDRMSLQAWSSVVNVNMTGAFLCGREAAGIMAVQGEGGLIVNISSVSRAGNMGQTNYSATKAGVSSMVVSWARELARFGIRVAGIAPGLIATDMTAQMKPEAVERMLSAVPLRRLGAIEEMAHSLQYIVENDYYTGRILEMDGGFRL